MQKVRAWRCSNGHALGLMVFNGRKVQHLLLYRQAIDGILSQDAEEPDVDVLAVIEWAAEVRCSICGCVKSWFPDDDAIARLKKQAQRMK